MTDKGKLFNTIEGKKNQKQLYKEKKKNRRKRNQKQLYKEKKKKSKEKESKAIILIQRKKEKIQGKRIKNNSNRLNKEF